MMGAGMSGSVNFVKSNINSNYASVTEQSGIKAGDGGFTVNVKGNTALVGGAITSTQAAIDNNKNSFNTGGTLTTSGIPSNL
jgi:filamentous hemagglutinin